MPGTPTKHEKGPIGTKGVDPYWTVRIRCESGVRIKNSRIRIQESGSGGIRLKFWYDSRIRTESGSGILLRFMFDVHLMDPDSRIRIQVRVTHTSFRKI